MSPDVPAATPLADYLVSLANPQELQKFRADPAAHATRAGLPSELVALVASGHPGALRLYVTRELEAAGLAPVLSHKFGGGGGPVSEITVNITVDVHSANIDTYHIDTTHDTTHVTDSDQGNDWREDLVKEVDAAIAYFARDRHPSPGELTVVGSGIRAITDMTLGAEAQIRSAEKVFYCVADPVTERRIHSFNPTAQSLYGLYDNDTPRIQTYQAMVDTILAPVRDGRRVCAVFYGHPGVFALPTHEAVRIARREGHRAEMQPAVSADASLFADLGIDPSKPGCHTLEATDLLIRHRVPDTTGHVLIWQAECVGDGGFNFSGYRKAHFAQLVDELRRHYPADHPVYIYEAASFPHMLPTISRSSLDVITAADLTGISTLYLPPAELAPIDRELTARLDL